MKKFLILILTFAYFASTSGATVHLHYCMGKLVEQNLWHNQKEECGKCGMDKSETNDDNGCCKDEHKQLKLDVAHKIAGSTFDHLQLLAIALPVSFVELPIISFSSIAEENPTSNAPPRSFGVAIYKRNCVFRI